MRPLPNSSRFALRASRLTLPALLALSACNPAFAPPREEVPGIETRVWRGEVRLTESLTLQRGTRLVIEPGTVVRLAYRDDDGDGWGDVSLRVEGDLVAQGTPDRPVVFTSENTPPQPGAWGELRIDFGTFDLRHTVIEGSTRGLHAHFSRGSLSDCVLRWNVDGTRLGESEVTVENNLFYGHPGKAYNARNCRNHLRGNRFHHNRSAVFLFQADRGSVFEANLLRHNDHPLRLGDFFAGRVTTRGNDWGSALPDTEKLAPGQELDAVPAPVHTAGPRGWPHWDEAWVRALGGGYVDSAPLWAEDGVHVATWAGEVTRLGFLDGVQLATARLPDTVDSAPAADGERLAVQSWDRGVYLLDRSDLRVLGSFREEPSPADDHRQAAPLFLDGKLYAATWAGRVRALEVNQGGALRPRWTFQAGGPFRADLTAAGGLLLAPCSDGTLYALQAEDGQPRWQFAAGAPLLSAAATDGSRAYLADREGRLWALALEDGRVVWQVPLAGPAWYAPPLLHEGVLYQGDDSGTVTAAAAADGAVSWTIRLDGGVRARPAAVGDHGLAVPTLGGRYYLLDARTGVERDCWQVTEGSVASPAAHDNVAVFAGRDGAVLALRAVSAAPAGSP